MGISETENLMSYFYSEVIITNIHSILVSEIIGTRHQKDCQENRKVVSIKDLWKTPLFIKERRMLAKISFCRTLYISQGLVLILCLSLWKQRTIITMQTLTLDPCVDKSRAVHVPGPLHMFWCWTPSHFILVLSDYCALVQWMGVRREAKHSRVEGGPWAALSI